MKKLVLVTIMIVAVFVAIDIPPSKLNVSLPVPVPTSGTLLDYCLLPENPSAEEQLAAGTPVAMTPVINGLDFGQAMPTEEQTGKSVTVAGTDESLSEPTLVEATPSYHLPTAVPTSAPVQIQQPVDFSARNFHVLFVGVGFSAEENPAEMVKLIAGVRPSFEGLRVDYAYANSPFDFEFEQLGTRIQFTEDQSRVDFLGIVKSRYPADAVVIAVKTNTAAGTSYNGGEVIIMTSNNPAWKYIVTHELGHQLGLGDAYPGVYQPYKFPNSELFYIDDMPSYLIEALNELGEAPQMYEVATCKGRKLYTFYPNEFNLMSMYVGDGPRPWGDSAFTPLQMIIMKNKIVDLKGE